MLTLITPTDGRPECFNLLQRWIEYQDYDESFQWVVAGSDLNDYEFKHRQIVIQTIPDPNRHPLCGNLEAALKAVRGQKILVIEDDDVYGPEYLATMDEALDHASIVGNSPARYYNVRHARWKEFRNSDRSSLSQTGFRQEAIRIILAACQSRDPFVDRRIWANYNISKKIIPNNGLHISIKGMPGRKNIGVGHERDMGSADIADSVFNAWKIPPEYRQFRNQATATHMGGLSSLVAPVGTMDCKPPWEGRAASRPWNYAVSAIVPHLNTPEPLRWVIRLLQLQTVRPYIIVIDTGSTLAICEQLEELRSEDVEIHYLRGHAWRHSSEPVCAAMDAAFGLCKTPYLYCTHADCFPMRRDWLEYLASRCSAGNPAVGYRMSPRDWITADWEWMVSHTATMLHMPTMWRVGATWSMQRYVSVTGNPFAEGNGFPDTETGLNWVLRDAGIKPDFLGDECNYCRQTDHNIDHVRSFASHRLYGVNNPSGNAETWMADAIAAASRRVKIWSAEPAARR